MFIVLSLICFQRPRCGSLLDDLPHGILHAANGILDLAGGLLGLAVRLQLGIADDLADGFLDRAFDASRGSRDSILIHDHLLLLYRAERRGPAIPEGQPAAPYRNAGPWGAWLPAPTPAIVVIAEAIVVIPAAIVVIPMTMIAVPGRSGRGAGETSGVVVIEHLPIVR